MMNRLRQWLSRWTGWGWRASQPFEGSAEYWRQRYASGGNSGTGSYGKFAAFKAEVLNGLVAEFGVRSVVEFGCGDGNQAALLQLAEYHGVDLSAEALQRCRTRFADRPGWTFALLQDYDGRPRAMALSLDVIYHLVEDGAYRDYMARLFDGASDYVVIYSSNHEGDAGDGDHVRHRRFADWVDAERPQWQLLRHLPNAHPWKGDWRSGSFADFYVYQRRSA